jgi:hypothetical protein
MKHIGDVADTLDTGQAREDRAEFRRVLARWCADLSIGQKPVVPRAALSAAGSRHPAASVVTFLVAVPDKLPASSSSVSTENVAWGFGGHHAVECHAVLGVVKAASLRSAAAVRGASGLDRACAQSHDCSCVMANKNGL